ncbi:HNH endonuclease signature motif containing protein [Nocardiopsis mangrovi]|uniref:HNH endonuclease signature motif containing protein n=1 Tax=Nocardiopsis mangrovi TaxID=1179818 RepID=A0ABV9DY23_9ACTN
MPKKKKKNNNKISMNVTPERRKSILLYHDMRVEEDFELCAQRIFEVVKSAAKKYPGKPRFLWLSVQGHLNDLGGFDHDSFEIISNFIPEYLFPYLTEVKTPLMHVRNPHPQREDIPGLLIINPPEDGSEDKFDHHSFARRQREYLSDSRSSKPSVRSIAGYLGRDGSCQICWESTVERAHALPEALGGSNDVRNFALLCPYHHQMAPDVADAEAFWKWIDYSYDRDSHMREMGENVQQLLRKYIHEAVPNNSNRNNDYEKAKEGGFDQELIFELKNLYGWTQEELGGLLERRLVQEFNRVRRAATTNHRGVGRKVSTYAWAYNVALRRVKDEEKIRSERIIK